MQEQLQHSSTVGFAMGCDIALNYPLWVAAKRLSVGTTAFPSTLRAVYRGGGALFLSLGPTTIIEDAVTTALCASPVPLPDIVSAASSGVVAAVLVTSQVEHVITRAHSTDSTMRQTFLSLYRTHGPKHLALPPGMAMMVCREIPFAATLFHVRPALTTWAQEQDTGPTPTSTVGWMGRELGLGCLTSMVTSPISHIPSVIAAYQQGHGVSFVTAVQQLLQAGGYKELWRGLGARTMSLAGTFTVVPIVMALLKPKKNMD